MKRLAKQMGLVCVMIMPFAVTLAQPVGGFRGPPSYEAMDLNNDGLLTQEEMYAFRTQRMKKRAEQGYPMRNAERAPAFEQIDSNGDGYVSREEMEAHRAARWQERDQWRQQQGYSGPGGWGTNYGYGRGYGPGPGYGYGPPPAPPEW